MTFHDGFDEDSEHDYWNMATPTESCREYARNVGAERPDTAWILTDFDTWERNPSFQGPPCHAVYPEDSDLLESLEFADHSGCSGKVCKHGFTGPDTSPIPAKPWKITGDRFDDDIPF